MITSLDGYVADDTGNFDWAMPDEEVHSFANALELRMGTSLYGRKMYEIMAVWDTMDVEHEPAPVKEYAQIWKANDKIVYSKTLTSASTPKTVIKADFDPEEVKQLKLSSAKDISISGPQIAAMAIKAGLVDEFHQFIAPVIVGGGNAWLPDNVRLDLKLVEEKRFSSGFVYLHYRVAW